MITKYEIIEYFDTQLTYSTNGWEILKDYLILSPYSPEIKNLMNTNFNIIYIKEINKSVIFNLDKLNSLKDDVIYELYTIFSNYTNMLNKIEG